MTVPMTTPGWVDIEPAGHAYFLRFVKKTTETKQKEVKLDEENELKIDEDCDLDDYYALLGLGHKRVHAAADEIRSAYKKISLKFHPDKVTNRPREEAEKRYKAIQEAHDTLKDPNRRLLYDSAVDFDDDIPDSDEEGDFYETFGEAFQRWGKWSENPKVPQLGGPHLPDEKVKAFYDFWYTFKSWRDFSYKGEYKLEEGQNREEKRWMIKQNREVSRAAKKEESSTIRNLVERAMNQDPRVKARKEREAIERAQEKARKQKEKEDRDAERKRKAAEALEIEEEKKRAIERERKKEARRKAREQRLLEQIKTKFMELTSVDPYSDIISPKDCDVLCRMCTKEELESLNAAMEKKTQAKQFKKILKVITKRIKAEKARKDEEEKEREKSKQEKGTGIPWNNEDLALLRKAVGKYPGGTLERWTKIAKLMGNRWTEQEIIAKVKNQKKVGRKSRPTSAENKNPNDEWTAMQQKQLEAALKETKHIGGAARWSAVADKVAGKDAKQCLQRCKDLRAKALARKQAAG